MEGSYKIASETAYVAIIAKSAVSSFSYDEDNYSRHRKKSF
jgi:hypothetical protein